VAAALDGGSCAVVCLKPARHGGIGPALEALAVAVGRGAPVWTGGMFEAGFGRTVLTTVAALVARVAPPVPPAVRTRSPAPEPTPGMGRWPGDLAAPRTYLADDVAPAPEVGRDRTTGLLTAELPGPATVGVAHPPDRRALERRAVRRVTVTR
jgi:hypothetical protein